MAGVSSAEALLRRDVWLMFIASLVLGVAVLCLSWGDAVRARYNRYCLRRDGERLVLASDGGQLQALSYQPIADGRVRFVVEARTAAGAGQAPVARYRMVVDLDCRRHTSQVLSVGGPGAIASARSEPVALDGDSQGNAAGWRYLLQLQYCD